MAKTNTEPSFETVMKRIEELTEKLEDPATGIEQSLGLYEEAMKLVGQAQTRLTEIEHKFEIISQRTEHPTKAEPDDIDEEEEKDNEQTSQHTLL